MQQQMYEFHMKSVTELKQRSSVDVWHSLQQNVIDAAINEWKKLICGYFCLPIYTMLQNVYIGY